MRAQAPACLSDYYRVYSLCLIPSVFISINHSIIFIGKHPIDNCFTRSILSFWEEGRVN